jgi:hypothetical protein
MGELSKHLVNTDQTNQQFSPKFLQGLPLDNRLIAKNINEKKKS